MSVDILTNEGSRALNHSITSGVKLYVEDAVLVNFGTALTTETAVTLSYSDPPMGLEIPDSVNKMTPVSCLPVQVETEDENVSALDIEFLYLPKDIISYNTIVVRARYYYPISVLTEKPYGVGHVVSYGNNYYKCIAPCTYVAGPDTPDVDTTHWVQVQIDEDSSFPNGDMVGDVRYKAISDEYIALYVSQMDNAVTLTDSLEIDYKLRLYLTNTDSATMVKERIYFDTLGPEFTAGAELNVLETLAGAFRSVRDVVTGMVNAGATSNTITTGTGSEEAETEEEEMKIAYFKTAKIADYEFTDTDTTVELSITDAAVLPLSRMDTGSGAVNYLSAYGNTKIVKARVTMGGAGTLASQAQKAANVSIKVGIPSDASSTGEFQEIGSFVLSLSQWSEWEEKNLDIEFTDTSVSQWKAAFQSFKPVVFQIVPGDSFFFMDYNIQEAFVGQTPAIEFPVYLEVGVTADTILGSDKKSIVK